MKITFRKGPDHKGRMRIADAYCVRCNGKPVATIQRARTGDLWKSDLWFWYTNGINTCKDPASLDRVKAAVREYFKSL